MFSLFIGTMTYFLDRFFIVIFNFCLSLPSLLIIFWIFSIFFAWRFRNISLIFNISLVLDNEDKACVYNFIMSLLPISWLLFLKNFKISLISLEVFAEIRGDNLVKLAGLSDLLFLGLFLISWILGINLDATFCLNDWLSLSVISESYFNL